MRSRTISLLISSTLLATVVACGSSQTPPQTAKASTSTADPSCPVEVPGTSVTVEDTDQGAALVFVTTGDLTEVRRRVAAMAKMHNDHHGAMGPLPDGTDAGGGHAGHDGHTGHDMGGHAGHAMGSGHDMGAHAGHADGMIGVHSKATASDVESGAKLVFVAGAADVAKLQSELRMHAKHLATGTCAMRKS